MKRKSPSKKRPSRSISSTPSSHRITRKHHRRSGSPVVFISGDSSDSLEALRSAVRSTRPLVEYLEDDREELHHEIFKLIKKKAFRSMLPDILKKYDIHDVKDWCLDQLRLMPKASIESLLIKAEQGSGSDAVLVPQPSTMDCIPPGQTTTEGPSTSRVGESVDSDEGVEKLISDRQRALEAKELELRNRALQSLLRMKQQQLRQT